MPSVVVCLINVNNVEPFNKICAHFWLVSVKKNLITFTAVQCHMSSY